MNGKRAAEYTEKNRLWQKHLGDWKRGGLTQAEYCRRNHLDPKNFIYWKKKIHTVPLVELHAPLVAQSSQPVTHGVGSPHLNLIINGRFRIEVPPGFDAETLDRLIKVLDRP